MASGDDLTWKNFRSDLIFFSAKFQSEITFSTTRGFHFDDLVRFYFLNSALPKSY